MIVLLNYVLVEPPRLCSHYTQMQFGFQIWYLERTVHFASDEMWSVCSDSIVNITCKHRLYALARCQESLIQQQSGCQCERKGWKIDIKSQLMSSHPIYHDIPSWCWTHRVNILHIHAYTVFKDTHYIVGFTKQGKYAMRPQSIKNADGSGNFGRWFTDNAQIQVPNRIRHAFIGR